MVKRAKLAAKKARKLLEGEKAAAPQEERSGPAPPQHIQRKLTRKVKFLERVAATKLAANKGGVTKKKKKTSVALTDLTSLTASLDEAAGALGGGGGGGGARRRFGTGVGTQKGRQRVAVVETQRLQQVLAHPQFQANPLAAVASHLAATLPTAPPPPSQQQQKDAATLRREKKKRRKERARGAAAMGDE